MQRRLSCYLFRLSAPSIVLLIKTVSAVYRVLLTFAPSSAAAGIYNQDILGRSRIRSVHWDYFNPCEHYCLTSDDHDEVYFSSCVPSLPNLLLS